MKNKTFALMMVVFMAFLTLSNGVSAVEGGTPATKDIVDTAVEAGQFKTLAAALEKAGLVDTLKGEGPYTVFAPTDAAFEKLLKKLGITAEELLAREDLKQILLYHVVSGKVMSTDLKDSQKAETLANKTVDIKLNPVRVNNANVVQADIQASNGVIHVIDEVLLPE
ncbi:fasciclin domain-containing protein [Rossellomorea vietnamensis]|uniref:fasciclin domain-containing protein n=1 Tax=Rossellomorea vietnamensis TaxID=218284 RepID=UPI001CCAC07C|nr:fasciclin domain-containing protein [Rossellomorea vietnamensis]MCA0149750.1 fasciclin domain-containing protein [Rossellomorea vietnamensis]